MFMEVLTEGPSASPACFNKDASDGSTMAGCRGRTHQVTHRPSLEACPAEALGGRKVAPLSQGSSAPVRARRARALGLAALVPCAIAIQGETRWLRSSLEGGRCSKGELQGRLNEGLQNLPPRLLSLYAHSARHVAVFPVPPSSTSTGPLCSSRQTDWFFSEIFSLDLISWLLRRSAEAFCSVTHSPCSLRGPCRVDVFWRRSLALEDRTRSSGTTPQ